MKKKMSWEAFSNGNRNAVNEAIKQAISDLALSLSIEIEENKIENLHQELASVVNISDFNTQNLNSGSL